LLIAISLKFVEEDAQGLIGRFTQADYKGRQLSSAPRWC